MMMTALPVQARTEILWSFEDPTTTGVISDYALSLSDTAKPNQQTAAIHLDATLPEPGNDTLLSFEPIPAHINRARVGGVSFEINASHDLVSDDPKARLQVILQSESDHWIPLGSISFAELEHDWKKIELHITDHEDLPAMKWLYAIRIQLVSTQPVSGEIYINDAGLILR